MEQEGRPIESPVFSSPEEELRYLREKVAEHEQLSSGNAEPQSQEAVISQTITAYAKDPGVQFEEHLILENPQFEKVLERINSVPHREKMRELYRVLLEKGILQSIRVVQSLGSPHLEDDFHGVLVDYIKTGQIIPGLDREKELSKLLRMTLFEVTLPFAGTLEGDKSLAFKEVIVEMERFYHGMLPLDAAPISRFGHFSLELVLSNFSNDIVFYIAVEEHMKDLFVKQILGAFPTAKIEEHHGDYNIFNEHGVSVGSYAEFTENFIYPISEAEDSEQDPFTTILNSFTKIEREGEGAAIQLVVYPDPDRVGNKIKHALGQIRQGVDVKRATDIPLSTGGAIVKTFSEFFHTQVKGEKKKDPAADPKEADKAQKSVELMEKKISAPLLRANLRIVVSAGTKDRAEAIKMSIEAAFNQFTRQQSNGLRFKTVEKARLTQLIRGFTYRELNEDETLVFNTKELATLYHLPVHISQKDAPQLKTVKASSAPPPSDLPTEGTVLGVSKYRGETREIRLTKADRLRHLYVIGQTGAGKSVLLQNLAVQDILAGNGVCFIDPHGSDVQDVLASVPKERIEDVIYFDPSYMERPFGLNMLEYDVNKPEQKIFVVNEMLSIFRKLYEAVPESMGPAFEQYFRNATMLVMEDPETGNTLLEIPRVMADANFRNLKLSRCKNPLVVQFWRDIATKTSGESGLANMIPYITNKFDVFLQNDIMRPIIAQEKSSFNFRDIMDKKKILLVNLSKGRLGDINANLIGLVLVGKFLMAALSRVDSYGQTLPDFYLYIDEFQNISTDSISSILSEARKYGLSLNVAHQFIAQLDEGIKKSVFGNVGNMVTFRVGAEDAEFLESQFAPIFKASDIMKIENRNAYAKILINGKPVPPFNIETLPPPTRHPEIVDQLKNLSYLKYGKDRALVDEAIMKKYAATSAQPAKPAVPVAAPLNQFAQALAKSAPPAPPAVFPQQIEQQAVAVQTQQVASQAQVIQPPQAPVVVVPPQQMPPLETLQKSVVQPAQSVLPPVQSVAALQYVAPSPVQQSAQLSPQNLQSTTPIAQPATEPQVTGIKAIPPQTETPAYQPVVVSPLPGTVFSPSPVQFQQTSVAQTVSVPQSMAVPPLPPAAVEAAVIPMPVAEVKIPSAPVVPPSTTPPLQVETPVIPIPPPPRADPYRETV